jgi:hypothetical protein
MCATCQLSIFVMQAIGFSGKTFPVRAVDGNRLPSFT